MTMQRSSTNPKSKRKVQKLVKTREIGVLNQNYLTVTLPEMFCAYDFGGTEQAEY